MMLDQETPSFSYEPKPDNARWIDSEEGVAYQATFDVDYLVPRSSLIHPYTEEFFHVSPFIDASGFFSDLLGFQRDETLRRRFLEDGRPIVERAITHYENENWALFDKEARSLHPNLDFSDRVQRFDSLCFLVRKPMAWLTFDHSKFEPLIGQRVALATSMSPQLITDELAEPMLTSGRVLELWNQVNGVRRAFLDAFFYLSPILQPLYWKHRPPELDDFVVCNKGFQPLKTLYVDAFETLARISVIALAIEAIIFHGELALPARRKGRKLSIHDLEALTSANKRDHLKNFPIAEVFVPFLETDLRNGIGHHAARYDAQNDFVICVRPRGEELDYWGVPYTEFCRKVMSLVSRLFVAELYLVAIVRLLRGRLRPTGGDSDVE
jgi:hypothetical protein